MRHTAALHQVQKMLSGNFSSLRIFTETAIVRDKSHITRISVGTAHNAVGARVGGRRGTLVHAVNLAHWLRTKCAPQHPGLPIVRRMDIESLEYPMLTDLAVSGAPIEMRRRFNTSLFVAIEWHLQLRDEALNRWPDLMDHLDRAMWGRNRAVMVPPVDASLQGYWG
eukprot:CAMPEP_0183350782 /NCGR_PEP_ID=MMETSP0164_2-20130417/20776_1 /TAXON_ID=221442 /ORGANISM="Coccolithus pelagicus ssp braarudi, Strain PLY182g" /LENGTH=166 /DNA_ID=CAMNT_0025522769 /DNA_START=231 /DNA_END=727 /DNA_ORIENTATION=-